MVQHWIDAYDYSTDWNRGGQIIEREGICHASIRDGRKIVGWRAAFKSDGCSDLIPLPR